MKVSSFFVAKLIFALVIGGLHLPVFGEGKWVEIGGGFKLGRILSSETVHAEEFTYPIDILDHSNANAFKNMIKKGIMTGYPDGLMRPESKVNRAEFLKMLMIFKEMNTEGNNCFPDVKDEWFAGYVCAAKKSGLIKGYPDGKFHGDYDISFAEAAKMIFPNAKIVSEAASLESGDFAPSPKYPSTEIKPWYRPSVEELSSRQAIPLTIKSFSQKLTRAEIAEIFFRLGFSSEFNSSDYEEILSNDPFLTDEEKNTFSPRQFLTYGPNLQTFPYYKDNKFVYFSDSEGNLIKLDGADVKTFDVHTQFIPFFIDKNLVYFQDPKIPYRIVRMDGADPKSFDYYLGIAFDDKHLFVKDDNGRFVKFSDFTLVKAEQYTDESSPDGFEIRQESDFSFRKIYPIFRFENKYYVYNVKENKVKVFNSFDKSTLFEAIGDKQDQRKFYYIEETLD